ncbi:class I SAM-dependent methyltransferase [Flavitalea flava]
MEPLVRNISDTAKWVAVFRAEETERPDAVFHDPYARRLAGERGEQIADAIAFSRKNSWSFVARTFLFDQYIKEQVAQGVDRIINLAAGLDARPYRMVLPPSLSWVEVDFPEILEYKESFLGRERPVCRLLSVARDLSQRKERNKLFRELNQTCKKALVVSEGLITYLTEEAVGELARDLSAQPHFHRWAFDLSSPPLLVMANKEMGAVLKEGNAVLQFAPAAGEDFFTPFGWKHLESRSKYKTAASLNRLTGDLLTYAHVPEPPGPRRSFPWSGVCLFENINLR